MVERDKHRCQYGACSLYAGYLRLHTHTHIVQDLLLFRTNNVSTNAPQCYIIGTLPVL